MDCQVLGAMGVCWRQQKGPLLSALCKVKDGKMWVGWGSGKEVAYWDMEGVEGAFALWTRMARCGLAGALGV